MPIIKIHSNENGYVSYPSINLATEMTAMVTATREYEGHWKAARNQLQRADKLNAIPRQQQIHDENQKTGCGVGTLF